MLSLLLQRHISVLLWLLKHFLRSLTFLKSAFYLALPDFALFFPHTVFVPAACCFTFTVLYKFISIMEGNYPKEIIIMINECVSSFFVYLTYYLVYKMFKNSENALFNLRF